MSENTAVTANVTEKKEKTGKVVLWALGGLLLVVIAFMAWATSLLMRASQGQAAAAAASGKPLEPFDPWKNNPYTSALPAPSGAPSSGPSTAPSAPPKP